MSSMQPNEDSDYVIKEFDALGTINQITVYKGNKKFYIDEAVFRVKEIDDKMSAFKADSEVSKINNLSGISAQAVSRDTFYVIERAHYYSEVSSGAFNLLIRPIINLWGINTNHSRIPDASEIQTTLKFTDYKDIVLDNENLTVKLKNKGQCIDLGAIAKGYAADEVKNILTQNSICSAIIDLGGNIVAVGSKPDGTCWKIGIQDPLDTQGEFIGIIEVKDKSVVTSGNYERFFIKDGIRYHHIIDPRTGYPSSNGIISVSIISDFSLDGDGLSTCAYVMGLIEGFELICSTPGADGIFITEDRRIYLTPGIKDDFILMTDGYIIKTIGEK